MKRTLILAIISLALSAALVSSIPDLSAFSYYVALVFNILAWVALLAGAVAGDAAHNIMRDLWVTSVTGAIGLMALVFSGHPVLAASSFVCTVLTVAVASAAKEKTPCKP